MTKQEKLKSWHSCKEKHLQNHNCDICNKDVKTTGLVLLGEHETDADVCYKCFMKLNPVEIESTKGFLE